MSEVESKSQPAETAVHRDLVLPPEPIVRGRAKSRVLIVPVLITLAAVAIAVPLGWAMWNDYMTAPWTRDGTVRAYVVTMAPEVAGRIVTLPVADNQFVHKGDLLLVIDPADYTIAVARAEAALQQAEANAQNAARESKRRAELPDIAVTVEEQQTYRTNAVAAQALYQQASANLEQARVNLTRTQIRSPVNGWVTNLLAQLGDYASVGTNIISVVDADSFWIDGYFEETGLGSVHDGDSASITLIGYRDIVRGHVAGIARGINVGTRNPMGRGWRRSTRSSRGCGSRSGFRCPSPSIRCRRAWCWWPGMTATVQIDPPTQPPAR